MSSPRPPNLSIKALPTTLATSLGAVASPSTLLSKEWVVPPRPKPGRKPALDAPATKRKAQNRAAQRAFRERRAARVGELEEQMKDMEGEQQHEIEILKANVERLQKEVDFYRAELDKFRSRDGDSMEPFTRQSNGMSLPGAEASVVLLPGQGEMVRGCGRCSSGTTCQCLDHALDAIVASTGSAEDLDQNIRSPSPAQHAPKRLKLEHHDELEIDFTQMFSKSTTSTSQPEGAHASSKPTDPCGFCSDGTPCICAEMAAEAQNNDKTAAGVVEPVVSRHNVSNYLYTPPPSEVDSHTAVSSNTNCAKGPGTCAQCQSDPQSTLFCKALAASRTQSLQPTGGCCGGSTNNGTCCKETSSISTHNTRSRSSKPLPPLSRPQNPSIALSCADAYTTLSRHPAYEQASGEMTSWLPRLHASSAKENLAAEVGKETELGKELEGQPDIAGRHAMEIDAANVMAVLKHFDRRFS